MSYYKERHNEIIAENVEVLKIPNLSFHKKMWIVEYIRPGRTFPMGSIVLALVPDLIYLTHQICPAPRRVLES
jgi:hypothetical protein